MGQLRHLRRGGLLLDATSGYGYRPLRSFLTYLLVVVAFAITYALLGHEVGSPVDQRVLTLADVDVVSSEILRVLIDSQVVQGYLQWLDTEYTKMGRPTPSHWRARRLAEQLVAYQKKRYRRPQVRRP